MGDDSTISAEEYGGWITAQAAMRDGYKAMRDAARVSDAILRRLNNDTLRASCKVAIWYDQDKEHRSVFNERRDNFPLLSARLWQRAMVGSESALWSSGDLDIYLDGKGATVAIGDRDDSYVSLVAVRFEPSGLSDMFPLSASSIPAPAPPPAASIDQTATPVSINRLIHDAVSSRRGKGGPKRKTWWDDLWIEVIKEIRAGTLTARSYGSAAKLEYHLDDLVKPFNDGNGAGDSTLKPMAQKLFKFLKEIGG